MRKRFTVHERVEQIRPYLASGMPAAAIARRLGLSESRVSRVINEARENGWLPRQTEASVFEGTRIGAVWTPLASQPVEVQEWVRDQIPEGGTVAEFAVSCMVDAYYEEQGDG
jgi:transposase-like protein